MQEPQQQQHRRIGSSSSDQNLTSLWRRIGVASPSAAATAFTSTAADAALRPRDESQQEHHHDSANDNKNGGRGRHSPLHYYDLSREGEGEEHDQNAFRRTSQANDDHNLSSSFTTPPQSPWICDSATPMTTRPHFPSHRQHSGTIRRVRSRSLGSSLERRPSPSTARGLLADGRLSPYLLLPRDQWRPLQQPQLQQLYDASDADTEATKLIQSTGPQPSLEQPSGVPHPNLGAVGPSFLAPIESLPSPARDEQLATDDSPLLADKLENHRDNSNEAGSESNPLWICVLYGFINATIVLPVLMSFASIIYRDQAFAPYMPVLVRLTMVSGIVHQLCFSALSSLPFAVGQVQDAGLIFLSSMASTIVQSLSSMSTTTPADPASLLTTTTVALSLGTVVLGVGLVVIGTLRLAGYAQLLPTCVIGGYLAYIGYFCGASGVELMASGAVADSATAKSSHASTIESESRIDHILNVLTFVLPGVLGGCVIYYCVRRFRHMAVLPTCICLELLLFYLVLGATGTSVDRATDLGWIRRMDDAPPWYRTWEYLRFEKVEWSVLPSLAVTELSMIFVVALSSSLDVAAIELELRRPLNYNRELSTVGVSNIVSGLTGGYTGSYIFSQSIFSLRAGIRSRKAGFALAATQLTVLLLPFNLLAYIPNFFFGSLLSLICVDLVFEWLWDVRHRLTKTEYVVCLATFGSIQAVGVEYGILAGVALYLLCRKLGLNVGRDSKQGAWSSAPTSTEPSPMAIDGVTANS